MLSGYYNKSLIVQQIEEGRHRNVIGGMWDEIGDLQIAMLRQQGMQPHNTLLDVGCGSLRLGVRAVAYLDAGKYWGTDLVTELMQAGYEKEIVPAGLADKLPREQLVADADFAFPGIPAAIDFAMATSVFTHLPLNHLRLCLANLGAMVNPGCRFYFTIFTPPDGASVNASHQQNERAVSHPHKDPYHYTVEDVLYAAKGLPWEITYIGAWDHPRNQKLVLARRIAV